MVVKRFWLFNSCFAIKKRNGYALGGGFSNRENGIIQLRMKRVNTHRVLGMRLHIGIGCWSCLRNLILLL